MTKPRITPSKNKTPVILTGLLLLIFLFIAAGVVSFLISWVQGAIANPGVMPGLPSQAGPSENVRYEFGQLLPTWTGSNRVTVLLLGIDERAHETGPFRTDTTMLLTLDPQTLQAGALSIPRDLWVPIPGYDEGRINTAHFLGDLYAHTGGGPALAVRTVEYNLGEPIHYYVRINFDGFVTLVDLIGGVSIYVEQTINDPMYPDHHYGYDPLYIEAGWHHFDGEMALKYARTRHGSSDFDRARRQQQLMLAILDRITSLDLLPELAKNAPEIYAAIETSVQTDLALDQMLALANLALKVDRSQIRSAVIDQTATQPWVTPDGAQVLIPLRDRMRQVRNYVFAIEPPTPTPDPLAGLQPTATPVLPTPTPEAATVSVLNGTIQAGLAGSTADYLSGRGIDVAHVGNAGRQDYATTIVTLYRDRRVTADRLVTLLGVPSSAIEFGNNPNAAHDIVVILGADYTGPEQ